MLDPFAAKLRQKARKGMRGKFGILACGVLCGVAALVLPAVAGADIGRAGPTYVGGTSGPPTTSKPESKLWFHDGIWWAVMAAKVGNTNDYHIFRLSGGTWNDTGVVVDIRDSTRQDVLSVGNGGIFVASHKFQETTVFDSAPEANDEMRFRHFPYNDATNTYGDASFTKTIDSQRSEALVIDRAQDGKLWATWVQQDGPSGAHRVFYSRTDGNCGTSGDCDWEPRAIVPGSTAVSRDDISALVRFGSRIGIIWSDQIASAIKFAHAGAPENFDPDVETAVSGFKQADDHINMKARGNGVIYVATKTKFDSAKDLNPQTRLLVRTPAGNWSRHTISFSPEKRTRPIVLIDETSDTLHVFETGPHTSGVAPEKSGGGRIFESVSRLSPINFAVLSRRPVIEDSSSPSVNNTTSTKQVLNASTDLVVVASDNATKRYWRHSEALTAPPPTSGGGCTIRGTRGPDVITGTRRRDVICGLGGNDIIRGFGGNDRIEGGSGNDRLLGMAGRDAMLGGSGRDVLGGGSGNDRLLGQGGRDRLAGSGGRDRLVGGTGRDRFSGGRGADTLISRDRTREVVNGGPGRDRARVNRSDVLRSIARLI
jgi:hypothetical protein